MKEILKGAYARYRLYTAPLRKSPDFLVVGAQKAGSTSLYEYIVQHPDILAARTKEVHYFTYHHDDGRSFYRANFPYSWSRGITGEATPFYLYHPLVALRVYDYDPNMKIIAVLREPVSRAISHYYHAVSHGFEKRGLYEAITTEIDDSGQVEERIRGSRPVDMHAYQELSYVSRGFYARQLDRYQELFGAENMLVMNSAELFRSPENTVSKVFAFLEVGTDFRPYDLGRKNPGRYDSSKPDKEREKVIEYLREVYRTPNEDLSRRYGITFDE